MDAKTMVDIRDKAWAACKGDDADRDLAGLAAVVAAAKVEALGEVYPMIRDLVDRGECWFDHHGGCQEHGYLSLQPGEKCPHAEAKEWLAIRSTIPGTTDTTKQGDSDDLD